MPVRPSPIAASRYIRVAVARERYERLEHFRRREFGQRHGRDAPHGHVRVRSKLHETITPRHARHETRIEDAMRRIIEVVHLLQPPRADQTDHRVPRARVLHHHHRPRDFGLIDHRIGVGERFGECVARGDARGKSDLRNRQRGLLALATGLPQALDEDRHRVVVVQRGQDAPGGHTNLGTDLKAPVCVSHLPRDLFASDRLRRDPRQLGAPLRLRCIDGVAFQLRVDDEVPGATQGREHDDDHHFAERRDASPDLFHGVVVVAAKVATRHGSRFSERVARPLRRVGEIVELIHGKILRVRVVGQTSRTVVHGRGALQGQELVEPDPRPTASTVAV